MVEGDLVQGGRRGKCRNMPADTGMFFIRFDDHCQSVPPNETADATFKLKVARISRFLGDRNRVDIWCVEGVGNPCPSLGESIAETFKEVGRPLHASCLEDILKRVQPFV